MTGWKTWAALEEVTAANMNSYVRDQTVQVFNNAASRTAAIASPSRGLVSFLTDSGALEVYYGATTGWAKPWNLPQGPVISLASNTTSQVFSTTTPTALTSMTGTWNATNGRLYRVTFSSIFDCPSVAPVTGVIRLWTGLATIAQANVTLTNVGDQTIVTLVGYQAATSTASYSVTAQAGVSVAGKTLRSVVGSGYPQTFLIEDIGATTTTAPTA